MVSLHSIRSGDTLALDELITDSWAPLVHHLTSLLGSHDAAEDAAQEALVRLWERREQWHEGSARGLLFRIARNVAFDTGRRDHARMRSEGRNAQLAPTVAEGPDTDLATRQLDRRVHGALQALSQRRREVFELVRFAGMNYKEVAVALELSSQTVANHMSAALQELRRELADLIADDVVESEPAARPNDG